MKNFKKALLMGLSFVLVAALAIGGTLAYLTSEDSDVNVMTLGKVSIKQNEQQLADDGVTLEPFEQAKGIYPGTDVSKIVTVENTGESDLYFRTLVAFEDLPNSETFGISFPIGEFSGYTWSWGAPAATIVIDGVTYQVYEARYNSVLKSGETSPASLTKVEFDATCTNEDMIALGDTYEILVLSQAVQAKGFENAQTALNEGFGSVAEKAAEWFGGIKVPTVVGTADELVAALENGEDVVLTDDIKIDPANMSNAYGKTGINVKNGQTIDGNGNTLDIKGAGGTWDSGINTTGGLIKNITVTGSFRGIFINHNSTHSETVVLENVTIDGTVYTISCDQGMNQNFEAYNSTFNGWTSYAATLGNAKFVDCSFGEGRGYAFCRPYAPTTFVGCDFEAGFKMDPNAAVTFENCTIDGVALTKDNLATLVTSNIANATVK